MKATRALGLELYARVRARPGNLLLSPYGIWVALAMLVPGARGRTRAQLADVLGIDDLEAVAGLRAEIARRAEPPAWRQGRDEDDGGTAYGFCIDVATGLWVQTGYRIAPDYGRALADLFGADPAPVDFAGAPAAACAAINRWVADRTRGRVGPIASPSALSPLTRALAASAVYFKAAWLDPFSPGMTRPAPFTLADGRRVEVPTMKRVGYYGLAADDRLTAIELRYVQPDVAMVVLLPHGQLDAADADPPAADRIDELVAAIDFGYVDLELPRFRFQSALSLRAALSAAGLTEALSPAADLSGISDEPALHVGEVLHDTFIAVDERGTEAAAVTALVATGGLPPPDPVAVRVDRPFYILIRDVPTGTALFFGRVVDPR